MARPSWEVDEEADEWAERQRRAAKEGMHNPKQRWPIELASKRGRIVLNLEEWNCLQKFIESHEKGRLQKEDYMHLPAKVRLVVHDWVIS